MNLKKEDLQRALSFLQGELLVLRDCLRDKGAKYFARPIVMGALLILGTHHYVYQAPETAGARADKELKAAHATARFAGDYKDLQARLDGLLLKLPRTRDPESWLLESIRTTLREEGIVPTEYSAPTDVNMGGYRFISITVKFEAAYKEIGSWVARVERGTSLLYIQSFTLTKKPKPIGRNSVDVTITTLVPAVGGAP